MEILSRSVVSLPGCTLLERDCSTFITLPSILVSFSCLIAVSIPFLLAILTNANPFPVLRALVTSPHVLNVSPISWFGVLVWIPYTNNSKVGFVVLWLMSMESFHLVEDATGLLDLGKYVLDVYLGVCLSNSRTLALFPLVLNWFFVLDELLLRMGNELLRCRGRRDVLAWL